MFTRRYLRPLSITNRRRGAKAQRMRRPTRWVIAFSLQFQSKGKKTPSSRYRQTACVNPFKQKIFNRLLTNTDLQSQVSTPLDELKQSYNYLWLTPFLITTIGSVQWAQIFIIEFGWLTLLLELPFPRETVCIVKNRRAVAQKPDSNIFETLSFDEWYLCCHAYSSNV